MLTKPRWLWSFGKHLRPPDLRVPNQGRRGEPGPTFFEAYGRWMGTPPPTWEDIAWLREQWGGAVPAQGHGSGGRRQTCRGCGCFGHHGVEPRRQQPGRHAGSDPLPARHRRRGGDQVEVLLDGGIRRGSDVVKAVALGARAVMIGRAYLWGLAANGQAGVENVLDILSGGIDSALRGLGKSSIHDLTPDDILVPEGFTRTLGVPRTDS